MTDFQPGDIIDVTITDLEVIGVDGTRTDYDYIKVQKPWRDHLSALHIPFDHPAVTISRRAPQPQADLLMAVSELHNAIQSFRAAEVAKVASALTIITEAVNAVTSAALAPVPADAEAVRCYDCANDRTRSRILSRTANECPDHSTADAEAVR